MAEVVGAVEQHSFPFGEDLSVQEDIHPKTVEHVAGAEASCPSVAVDHMLDNFEEEQRTELRRAAPEPYNIGKPLAVAFVHHTAYHSLSPNRKPIKVS